MASQTRAVGERAAKLVGVELPKKAEKAAAPVKKAAGQEGPGQEGPAPRRLRPRRLPAKKVTQK